MGGCLCWQVLWHRVRNLLGPFCRGGWNGDPPAWSECGRANGELPLGVHSFVAFPFCGGSGGSVLAHVPQQSTSGVRNGIGFGPGAVGTEQVNGGAGSCCALLHAWGLDLADAKHQNTAWVTTNTVQNRIIVQLTLRPRARPFRGWCCRAAPGRVLSPSASSGHCVQVRLPIDTHSPGVPTAWPCLTRARPEG